jgi:hypothetical protein
MSSTLAAAVKILLIGGLANLVFSFALGWVLSLRRMKEPITRHRWLLVAHTVSLQEGLLLLGLSYALTFADMSGGLAVTGAWLLVLGSVFQDLSGLVNWLRRTDDQFAEKSTGWLLASINAVLNTAGLAIVVYGILRGVL